MLNHPNNKLQFCNYDYENQQNKDKIKTSQMNQNIYTNNKSSPNLQSKWKFTFKKFNFFSVKFGQNLNL